MPTVAVIGAGPSGLAAAKAAVECDLVPTVFERDSCLGGVWRAGNGITWDSLCTNLAAEECSYSDFPWPANTPTHPHRAQMLDYLERFADAFELRRHVRFSYEVCRVERDSDEERWSVSWRSVTRCASGVEHFDFVIVCSGFFSRPRYPACVKHLIGSTKSGETKDNGSARVLHSSQYKNPSALGGQRVLVVGSSFSGADIAAEIASAPGVRRVVSAVGRRPLWYIPRCDSRGIPFALLQKARSAQRAAIALRHDERKRRMLKHADFRSLCGVNPGDVDPTLRITDDDEAFFSISSTYLEAVKQGKIVVRPSLVKVEGATGFFSDGQQEDVDVILCATGFHLDLPFFDKAILELLEFVPEDSLQPLLLHKQTFCPYLPNLAFVGFQRSFRFAAVELQARWACLVFGKHLPVPTDEEMKVGIEKERTFRESVPRARSSNVHGLIEDIAELCGIHPLRGDISEVDEELKKWLVEGPVLPAHFRLQGPHANREVALSVIQTCNRRIEELQE